MTEGSATLDYADRLLEGEFGLGVRGPRTAALLGRTVLEKWLDEQCASWSSSTVGHRTAQFENCCARRCAGRFLR